MNQFSISGQKSSSESQGSFSPITRRHFRAMLLVMVLALGYATYETQFNASHTTDDSPALQKMNLIINDDSNGDILITVINLKPNSESGVNNQVLRFSGEQGFLRGTLRALARERHMRNLTSDAPFELALHEDGRLTITDTLTNKGIDLQAFGPDNVAVFAKILAKSAIGPNFNQ